ncbi:FAD-binding protein, partial [Francisella tularensis subsp. holarctica]|uniref:FAD-binding protein n=1 Tax=Francisella tularensis TaxID=263 RepID=UPI002381B30B
LHTLYQGNLAHKTDFYTELFAVDLVKADDGSIAGVIAICIETGETVFLKAKITILATGGAGSIYESSTNAYINTVDGMGLALRAG